MSILIKGMAIPKNCTDCPLFESKYHFHGCHAVPKSFNDMDMWNFVGDRPTWCPLIELPPHGRLIDADALMKSIASTKATNRNAFGVYMLYGVIADAVKKAPTIIESEKEDG